MTAPEKRAEILEKHGWQPGEREATQAEMAERARRIAHESAVAWAQARNAERVEAERQPKTEPSPIKHSTEAKPMTDDWVDYIRRQIDKRSRAMEGAIADVLGPIEKKHKEAIDEVRTELAVVKNELSQLRAETKLRGALDDVQARLAKLETPPRLKAMG